MLSDVHWCRAVDGLKHLPREDREALQQACLNAGRPALFQLC